MSGPVFKRVAKKIYTDTPLIDEVESLVVQVAEVDEDYDNFYQTAQTYKTIMPNLVGMPAMDAIVLLENMQVDINVKLEGHGVVNSQSINKNKKLKSNQTIVLKAS